MKEERLSISPEIDRAIDVIMDEIFGDDWRERPETSPKTYWWRDHNGYRHLAVRNKAGKTSSKEEKKMSNKNLTVAPKQQRKNQVLKPGKALKYTMRNGAERVDSLEEFEVINALVSKDDKGNEYYHDPNDFIRKKAYKKTFFSKKLNWSVTVIIPADGTEVVDCVVNESGRAFIIGK